MKKIRNRPGAGAAFGRGALAGLLTVLGGAALAAPQPPEQPDPPQVRNFTVAASGVHTGISNLSAGSVDFLAAPLNVMGQLYPPSLIMRKQQEIGLSSSQAEAIKAEMRAFQSKVVDVQWDMNARQASLDGLLAADHIDAAAAEVAIDALLQSENALKKAHLLLLIAIRNTLEPAQIEQLDEARRGSFFVHPLEAAPPVPLEAPAPD